MHLRSRLAEPSAKSAAGASGILSDAAGEACIAYGSAVLSAAPDSPLGGDVVDVFAIDNRLRLILVADISGKGLDAAPLAAFIRYTVRTLAIESDGDPAVIMAKFNAIYCRTVADYEAFVVAIIGIVDTQTGVVRYASAGHEPAFVRRAGTVSMLAPTGPIVGVSPLCAYATGSLTLGWGDMLVWATDGLTESRDAHRRLLGAHGLADWVAAGPADAAGMADGLIAALHERSGARAGDDDVAVLAVACGRHVSSPVGRGSRTLAPARSLLRRSAVRPHCGALAR